MIEKIAEARILEAMQRGEFDKLSGAGNPLVFEDDSMVPSDLRMAYKILKNAGCLPPELELRKEIASLAKLIGTLEDDQERGQAYRKPCLLLARLDAMPSTDVSLELEDAYYQKLINRFET